MVKPIVLKFENGTEYTLEFNRESVVYAENHSFSRSDISEKLMVRIPELFFYAFRMHHPTLSRKRTDEILFDELQGLDDKMIARLIELYNEPYTTLLSGDTRKNSTIVIEM